jgi:Zn-dependent protease
MTSSFKIARVWGIPIRLHVSLALVVVLLVLRYGPLTGLLLEAALVLSIVLHELGHSLVALRKGCRVREITLLCIGGAAQMERIPTRPLDEFLMALAGPAVSFAIGLLCVLAGPHLPLPHVRGYPVNLVEVVGWGNFGLVTFNLLPSFPMDGGRVLRAALTPRLGRLRATFIAARLGRILSILFGVYGFFTDNWILVFIAFFVFTAAGNEYRHVQMQEAAARTPPFSWAPPGAEDEPGVPPPDDETVTIGPPPYGDADESSARIRRR